MGYTSTRTPQFLRPHLIEVFYQRIIKVSRIMQKRIAIAGYYGFGNIGDEAILVSMLSDLSKVCPNAEFVILSENPSKTTLNYGVKSVSWRDLEGVISLIEQSDLLIVGGGGLYNSWLEYNSNQFLTQTNSLFSVFIFSLPFLASLLNKPCVIYAVGASVVNGEEAKKHICMSFKLASLSTVRDFGSKAILESFGCPADRIHVTADPAFRLPDPDPERVKQVLTTEGISSIRPLIGVVLRNWHFLVEPAYWESEIASALSRFVSVYGGQLLFIPFQRSTDTPFDLGNDASVISRVQRKLSPSVVSRVLEGFYSPTEISGILNHCDLVLGMRLHSAILAIRNAVPFIALSYEPKVYNVLAMAGLAEYVIDLVWVSSDRVLNAITSVYREKEHIRSRLQTIRQEMAKKAFENVHLVAEFLASDKLGSNIWHNSGNSARPYDQELSEFVKHFALKQTKLMIYHEKRNQAYSQELLAYHRALRSLVDSEKFDVVLPLLAELLRDYPDHPEWNYLAGFCLHMTGKNLREALRYYNLALDLGFDEFWIRYNRGSLYLRLGDTSAAKADLQRAMELCPQHPGPKVLLENLI